MKDYVFPQGFMWGAATASHQIEGHNFNSDWYAWELKGKIKDESSSHPGCNSEQNFSRDIDLVKNLNLNSYRFSIEWAKIQPSEDKFDEDVLNNYLILIKGLVKNNIDPMVTLFHFSLPLWFAQKGGFEKEENIKYFLDFIEKFLQIVGDLVQFYIVINEPMVYVYQSYITGEWPPGEKNMEKSMIVARNLLRAYDKAYNIIKTYNNGAKVSIAKHTAVYIPNRKLSIFDNFTKKKVEKYFDHAFIDSIINNRYEKPFGKNEQADFSSDFDFIGINYYTKRYISYSKGNYIFNDEKNEQKTDIGWYFYPEGIYDVLKRFKRYDRPLIITENGIADKEDRTRNLYIIKTINKIYEAMKDGINVAGYMHWSLMDNFEWVEGQKMCFGLYETHYSNLYFTLRSSGNVYSRIVYDNALNERFLTFIK